MYGVSNYSLVPRRRWQAPYGYSLRRPYRRAYYGRRKSYRRLTKPTYTLTSKRPYDGYPATVFKVPRRSDRYLILVPTENRTRIVSMKTIIGYHSRGIPISVYGKTQEATAQASAMAIAANQISGRVGGQ